jgi:hypothetical protein
MAPNAIDYIAIQNTIARYCHALDTKDFDVLDEVFAKDVEAIYPIRKAKGVDEIKAAIEKRYIPHHPKTIYSPLNFKSKPLPRLLPTCLDNPNHRNFRGRQDGKSHYVLHRRAFW